MSIVERALQKGKQQAKAVTAEAEQARVDTAASAAAAQPSQVASPSVSAPVPPAPVVAPVVGSTAPTATSAHTVVQIDLDALRSEGRLPPPDMALQTEEEIRRIKWPLLNAITGRSGAVTARNNVVMVTSAVPAEGKTFTSLNLALSIVRDREMRVILVDGDVARPGITPSFRLDGARGLNDLLDDNTLSVDDVIYPTNIDGLDFVPAGKWHEHSAEFFAGSRMQQIINALSARVGHGVVIFDSSPLLATNDAQAATRFAGQVLLVVRADHTEQSTVLDALSLVDKATPVSAVLNRVENTVVSRYYGQNYYGYGEGGGYGRGRAGKGAA